MLKIFKDRFLYDWFKYLLVVILSIFLWSFAFNLYHKPNEEETLRIFYSGEIKESIEDDLLDVYIEDGINFVDTDYMDTSSIIFNEKYNLVALTISEIVIVKKSVAELTYLEDSFMKLDDNYGLTYLVQEGNNYGLVINSNVKNKLDKYFIFSDDEYVILFSNTLDINIITKFMNWVNNV